jgi:NADH:ubiquinone oxidoreductase subunit 3 (subunit A)
MDNEKNLKLMKFWLFGTFVIVFVATTVYVGAAIGTGLAILGTFGYWSAMVVTAVLCVAWYYIYKWYLNRS